VKFETKLGMIKERMVEAIKTFANIRIIKANQVICAEAIQQIKPDEVVLTYGCNYSIK